MDSHNIRDYLETEVMTAAPQKLQLMLIEAAIRQSQRARELWAAEDGEEATEALIRAQQIVTELLCSVNPEKNPDLAKKATGVYLFIFRTLITAQMERSEEKLEEALKVLKVERETWQLVCEKLGTTRTESDSAGEQTGGLTVEA